MYVVIVQEVKRKTSGLISADQTVRVERCRKRDFINRRLGGEGWGGGGEGNAE